MEWQTTRFQKAMGSNARAGSTPAIPTKHKGIQMTPQPPTSLEMTKKSLRKAIPLHQWIRKEKTFADRRNRNKYGKEWLKDV